MGASGARCGRGMLGGNSSSCANPPASEIPGFAGRLALDQTGLFRHLLAERSHPIRRLDRPVPEAPVDSIRAGHVPRNPRSPTAKAIDALTWRAVLIDSGRGAGEADQTLCNHGTE